MPPKKKTQAESDAGVEISTSTERVAARYEDGVSVRTPDAPAQTAGADNGQSAGTKKEKD